MGPSDVYQDGGGGGGRGWAFKFEGGHKIGAFVRGFKFWSRPPFSVQTVTITSVNSAGPNTLWLVSWTGDDRRNASPRCGPERGSEQTDVGWSEPWERNAVTASKCRW